MATCEFTGGTASASTTYPGYPASNAFDENTGTRWSAQIGDTTGSWIKYDFGSSNEKTLGSISLKSYLSRVDNFKVQGSNNDSDWDGLLDDNCPAADGTYPYDLTTTDSYRYYKLLTVSVHSGTANTIWEWEGYAGH